MAKDKNIVHQIGKDALEQIRHSILILRGKQVLLDFQLAALYGVETRVLKQAVRRNNARFPEDFMFRLTQDECNFLISNGGSQIVTPSGYNFGGYNPYAFTEQGVAMLSSVLRSETAVQVNIAIMRAFVMARQIVTETRENTLAIDELRARMRMLEDALENNLEAVNDLSEETRNELENIYNAIGALSIKVEDSKKREPIPEVGFAATERRWQEAKKGKK